MIDYNIPAVECDGDLEEIPGKTLVEQNSGAKRALINPFEF